jgi:hypothetical protein
VVWIRDELDKKSFDAVDACFSMERICLPLRRFHCLRAATSSVPDSRLERDLLKRAPILYFYDPSGRLVGTLEGKRGCSASAIERRVKRLWDLSFTVRIRDYLKRMDDILDRTAALERSRAGLARKKELARDRPRKLAALEKQEEQLELTAKRIAADEKKIMDACRLRKQFRKLQKTEKDP